MSKTNMKRAEILETAYRIFSEKGYHSTRIEDIARDMGMAQGLFYRYFRNKFDVFCKVIDSVISRITVGVMSDAPGTARTLEEYIEQMKRALAELFEIFIEDPRISRLLFYESLGIDDETNRKVMDAMDLFGEYSSSYIKHGIESGFLRPDIQVQETAYAFNAVVFEAVRRISQSDDKERARSFWMKAIVDLMIRGMAEKKALDDIT